MGDKEKAPKPKEIDGEEMAWKMEAEEGNGGRLHYNGKALIGVEDSGGWNGQTHTCKTGRGRIIASSKGCCRNGLPTFRGIACSILRCDITRAW